MTRSDSDPGGSPDDPAPADDDRFRKVFKHSHDAIMIVDLDEEAFVEVNPAACDLLGYSRAELLDLDPADIHPDDIDRVREEFIAEVRETGSGFTDDITCLTSDGREVPTEVSGAALGDGEPSRMIAILRDVSERVRRQRELEEKVQRLDRFAGVVSHDLQSPLNTIAGRIELARETGDMEHLDAIERSVERINRMLTGLLELAREGDAAGEPATVDLEAVCRDAWDGVEAGGSTLVVESSTALRADPERFRELLENLFWNSVEHGGRSVTVTVGDLPDGFYVADDGPGVPADRREQVFEWGHTTESGGTGLGLAIVDRIAEAHGWDVTLTESAEGGARFEFRGVDSPAT